MSRLSDFLHRAVSATKSALGLMRRNLKKTIAIIVALFLILVVYGVTRPKQAVYVTAVAERGDLRQLVEAVGTVTSEKDLALQFPTLDVVSQVYVKEGQKVNAGDRLAQLRSGTLAAGVSSAVASVQSAQAALDALTQGSRPEDIAIAEAGVANKRAALEAAIQTLANAEANLQNENLQLTNLKTEAAVSLSGQVTTAGSTISQQLATSKTALTSVRGVFNANDVQDAVVKSIPTGYDTMQSNITTTLDLLTSLQNKTSPTDYQSALKAFDQARAAVFSTTDVLNRAYDIMANLTLTSAFTQTSKETNKNTIATQKSAVQSALSTLDAAANSLRDASAGYDSKIFARHEGPRER